MRLTTTISTELDASIAIQQLKATIKLDGLACFVCYFTQEYASQQLSVLFAKHFPNIPFIGCSSCQGVITESGYHQGPILAVLSIHEGTSTYAYGSGFVSLNNCSNYGSAAQKAINQALLSADRVGEVPELVIVHSTSGHEEQLIEAIDQLFATQVQIIGGTAADNDINGKWMVMTENDASNSALSVLVCFPSKPLATGLSVGYSPTEFSGTITKAFGRRVYEIDHDSAKETYKEWVSDHSAIQLTDEHLFSYVSEFPIGIAVGNISDRPYFKLSHPVRVTCDAALEMFADMRVGDQITLMTGSKEHLINRASRVVNEANTKNYNDSLLLGAIVIFCAGSMLRLGDDIHKVHEQLVNQMNGRPFICPFTFGEQGRLVGGENAHGNLMISSAIFYELEN